jgi:hypothetical protein
MIFGLPAVVGAGLIGTAAFGIAKLAGASTKTALLAGLGTFGGMAALNAMNPSIFGAKIAEEGAKAGVGSMAAADTLTKTAAATSAGAAKISPSVAANIGYTGPLAGAAPGVANITPAVAQNIGYTGALAPGMASTITPPATTASPGLLSQASDFIGNMSTAEKIGLGVGGASLLSS